MSGAPEAAASLFGSAEESADPFAVIGTNSPDTSSDGSNLFPNDGHATFLQSDSGVIEEPTYPIQGTRGYQAAPAGAPWPQNDYVQESQAGYQGTSTVANSYQPTSYAPSTGYVAQQSSYTPSTNQPYAAAPAQHANTWSSNQSAPIDRYAPAAPVNQTSVYNPYDYSQPAASVTTTTATPFSQYAPSVYSNPPLATAPPPAKVASPPPPKPKAAMDGPKVVNAYDPPFPTTTNRRTTRQTSTGNYGVFGGYQPTQPLPPPSPFYATNQFADQQNQAHSTSHYGEPPRPPAGPPPPPRNRTPYGVTKPPLPRTPIPDHGAHYGEPPLPSVPRTKTPYGQNDHASAGFSGPGPYYGDIKPSATPPPPRMRTPYGQTSVAVSQGHPSGQHAPPETMKAGAPPPSKRVSSSFGTGFQPAPRTQTPDSFGQQPPLHKAHNRSGSHGQNLARPPSRPVASGQLSQTSGAHIQQGSYGQIPLRPPSRPVAPQNYEEGPEAANAATRDISPYISHIPPTPVKPDTSGEAGRPPEQLTPESEFEGPVPYEPYGLHQPHQTVEPSVEELPSAEEDASRAEFTSGESYQPWSEVATFVAEPASVEDDATHPRPSIEDVIVPSTDKSLVNEGNGSIEDSGSATTEYVSPWALESDQYNAQRAASPTPSSGVHQITRTASPLASYDPYASLDSETLTSSDVSTPPTDAYTTASSESLSNGDTPSAASNMSPPPTNSYEPTVSPATYEPATRRNTYSSTKRDEPTSSADGMYATLSANNGYAPPSKSYEPNTYAPPSQSANKPPPATSKGYGPNTYVPAPQANPYAPPQPSTYAPSHSPEVRTKTLPFGSAPPVNPYAPMSQAGSYGPPPPTVYGVPPTARSGEAANPYVPYRPVNHAPLVPPFPNSTSVDPRPPPSTYAPQRPPAELAPMPLVSAAYAPSPSLLGADDPLSRVTARVPVFSFGFAGRFVTCFHGAASLSTGFDVALSSRNTTSIKIHTLNKLLPKSALSESEAEYPGPLYPDTSASAIGLVRSTAASQAKSKKSKVVQYLEARTTELGQGLGYMNPPERRTAEARLVLLNILKIMVENDGKLFGSAAIDSAVRSALVPRLAAEATPGGSAPSGFSADSSTEVVAGPYSGGVSTVGFEQPISVTSLRPSSLNKIEDLLMRGERKQAYTYALDEKLWAHAMVIASSIDKDAWKEAVNEFIQSELGSVEPPRSATFSSSGDSGGQTSASRDSLRVAYKFFSGQGSASVQELIPKQALGQPPVATLLPPTGAQPGLTPRTPAFPPAAQNLIAPESLGKWKEAVSMIISSPASSEAPVALTALGDQLLAYNWLEAAHVCYLLSPQTSPFGGSGSQAARITLLGSKPPHLSPLFIRNMDNIILTEIMEFALSLVPTAKGQEQFGGVAHLQPYRLLHASYLAELGYIQEAGKYCDAITAALAKPSPWFTPTFVHQLRLLADRISGAPSEKSNSWIGAKITKPSLDSIGGWLEGRFTKLVAGDGEADSPKEATQQRPFDGPFAHYSTISTTPSARSSPQPRPPVTTNPYQTNTAPQRTSSAMAMSPPYQSYQNYAPIDRAASAIDYIKHNKGRPSPPPPVPPLPAHLNNHVNKSLGLNTQVPHGHGIMGTSPISPSPLSNLSNGTGAEETAESDPSSLQTPVQEQPQASSWWDYSSANAQTPTASTFQKVDEPIGSVGVGGDDGFISLMGQDYGYGAPAVAPAPAATRHYEEDEELEDLGFGNSKKEEKVIEKQEEKPAAAPTPAPPPKDDSAAKKNTGGGSWLGRWWGGKKDDAAPGPVKANLGEENSFYYDKELKRWVNKKAGADETKPPPGPPPPPTRAQTASPSRAAGPGGRPPFGGAPSAPPPQRSSSAMAMSSEVAPPARVRSNLVPTPEGSNTPPPPPPSAPGPPFGGPPGSRPSSAAAMAGPPGPGLGSGPPSRPASGAARKKNLRSRYVDVFQEGAPQ